MPRAGHFRGARIAREVKGELVTSSAELEGKALTKLPAIIVDTREQRPFEFAGLRTSRERLKVGDYSLRGYSRSVSVERKSVADFVLTLTKDRDRFERELRRAEFLHLYVVVEGSLGDLQEHLSANPFQRNLSAHRLLDSAFELSVAHQVPFLFAAGRAEAELMTLAILRGFLRWSESLRKRAE